jgi:hypothetical protein
MEVDIIRNVLLVINWFYFLKEMITLHGPDADDIPLIAGPTPTWHAVGVLLVQFAMNSLKNSILPEGWILTIPHSS